MVRLLGNSAEVAPEPEATADEPQLLEEAETSCELIPPCEVTEERLFLHDHGSGGLFKPLEAVAADDLPSATPTEGWGDQPGDEDAGRVNSKATRAPSPDPPSEVLKAWTPASASPRDPQDAGRASSKETRTLSADTPSEVFKAWTFLSASPKDPQEQPTTSLVDKVSGRFVQTCREFELAVQEDPEVAVMLKADPEAPVALPSSVEVCLDRPTTFFEEDRRLLVCRLKRAKKAPALTPAKQLLALEQLLRGATAGARADDGPWLWPLHSERVVTALVGLEELMLAGGTWHMRSLPRWKRILYWLRIHVPDDGGPFFRIVEDVYGPSVAFNFRWAHFYTQQVWLLALLVLITLCVGIEPSSSGTRRGFWEVTKLGMLFWAFRVANQRGHLLSRIVRDTEEEMEHAEMVADPAQCKVEEPKLDKQPSGGEVGEPDHKAWTWSSAWSSAFKLSNFAWQAQGSNHTGEHSRDSEGADCRVWTWSSAFRPENPLYKERGPIEVIAHWMQLVFLVVPGVAVFVMVINLALLGAAQLIVHLTYVWGDCMNLGCRDPVEKHGFLGWLAEVSVDILMAIFFELFFILTKKLAEWLAEMRNYRREDERRLSVEMLTVVIFAVERIGTFGIVAILFVPQWEVPPADDKVDMSVDCSDLVIGDASFFCLQRRLPLRRRQDVFARSLTGPFVVAPYVNIGIKVLAPLAADRLDQIARKARCCGILDPCFGILRGTVRILAIVFAYEGDSVGCLSFVAFGWPFGRAAGAAPQPGVASKAASGWPFWRAAPEEDIGSKDSDPQEHSSPRSWEPPEGGDPGPDEDSDPQEHSSPRSCEPPEGDDPGPDEDCAPAKERPWQVKGLLQQAARKPFEPMSELLEMELNFLWVVFFAPVLPWGIIPMLLARIFETKSDLTKLLFVRRRCFPEPDGLERSLQRAFLRGAVCSAVGWSAGLSLITYNSDLWQWGWWKVVCSLVVLLWLMGSAGISLMHADASWCVMMMGVAILVLIAVGFMLIYDEL